LVVIVIGTSPTSGASIFGFIGRIVGTIVSMVLSLVVWYIVGGHIGGVIVFLYVANCFEVDFKAMISAKKTMELKSIQSSVKFAGRRAQLRL
jgi:hypothetical protein